jgi:uncharacterized protein (DUF433 family)
MNLRPSENTHILLDEQGRGWIDDTNVKVVEIVLDKLAYCSTEEEIHEVFPQVSLAQIHDALSHYYDHQAEYDAEIARLVREAGGLRGSLDAPGRRQLRALGMLP